jgi:glycosyltransferase involved in cell wall biosynthesis
VLGLMDALRADPSFELELITTDRMRARAGDRRSQVAVALLQCWRLWRTQPDVVHTHDHPALLAAAVAYRSLARRPVRVIYTCHLDPVERRAAWKRRALGWLLSRCAAVTVVSRNSVEKLRLVATPVPPAEVVKVVPGAAQVRARDKADPEVGAFADSIGHRGGPVLLQVANFWFPAKVEGTVRLMEALIEVRRQVPNVRLILVGTGPLIGEVAAARDRLGLADSVTLPASYIEDLSLPVGLADVQCHITFQDACPISILEAMHAAKPLIASNVGGIPELIDHDDTGVLVGNDAAEIAAAILDLLHHPARAAALGARARAAAQSRFTWDRVALDFARLYTGMPEADRHRTRPELADVVP